MRRPRVVSYSRHDGEVVELSVELFTAEEIQDEPREKIRHSVIDVSIGFIVPGSCNTSYTYIYFQCINSTIGCHDEYTVEVGFSLLMIQH